MASRINCYNEVDRYCPHLEAFVRWSPARWRRTQKRWGDRTFLIARASAHGEITVETTLYDVIERANHGDSLHTSFLVFIDGLFADIQKLVPERHHPRIRHAARSLVSEFDETRSGYLNPIGELSALLLIVKHLPGWELKEIEPDLGNGRHADFLFADTRGRNVFVEVQNIHLDDEDTKSAQTLRTKLVGKLEIKNAYKTDLLQPAEDENKVRFFPVVWVNFDLVRPYLSIIQELEVRYETVSFAVMGQAPLPDGSYRFTFQSLQKSLEFSIE